MSLTAERLRELLDYDPATGIFRWKICNSNRAPIGAIAGCTGLYGYCRIVIDKRIYVAHRLAWLYMTGEWPRDEVDHRNCKKSDNRWSNLRAASSLENKRNVGLRRDNKSGLKGVIRGKNGKWVAAIRVNKKKKHLGCFDSIEAAHAVYVANAVQLFGQFARAESIPETPE